MKSVIYQCRGTVEASLWTRERRDTIMFHGIDLGCGGLDVYHGS